MSQQHRLRELQQAVDKNNADNTEKEESVMRSIAALSVNDLHEQAIKRKELYLHWNANFVENIHASFGQVLTVMNYTRAFADGRVREEIRKDLSSAVSDCEDILKVVPENQKNALPQHTAELREHLRELEEHEHLDHWDVLNRLQFLMHGFAKALGLVREKIEDLTGEEGCDADDIDRVSRLWETEVRDQEEELVEEGDEEYDTPPPFMLSQGSATKHQEEDVPPVYMFPTQTKSPKQLRHSRSKRSDRSYSQEY